MLHSFLVCFGSIIQIHVGWFIQLRFQTAVFVNNGHICRSFWCGILCSLSVSPVIILLELLFFNYLKLLPLLRLNSGLTKVYRNYLCLSSFGKFFANFIPHLFTTACKQIFFTIELLVALEIQTGLLFSRTHKN